MITLVKSSIEYADSITAYRKAFEQKNECFNGIDGSSMLVQYDNIVDWFDFIKKLESIDQTPKHLVPAISYLLVDTTTQTVIGMTDLRLHIENDYLAEIGGHIGYSIHPDYRKQGYGKLILAHVLEKAKQIGLQEVMVTCDDTNVGSRKIIEANGGEFERLAYEDSGNVVRRYWITLNK